MPIDITMPALSPTMESGTLARWLIKPGDEVRVGDVIAEIETDKATMEVEAVDEGTVLELLVPEGAEEVKVNAVIARLAGEGEASRLPASAPAADKGKAAVAPAASVPVAASVQPPEGRQESLISMSGPMPSAVRSGDRIIASPLARRMAGLLGVELAGLQGSGPKGRIVKVDVEAAAGRRSEDAEPAGSRTVAADAGARAPLPDSMAPFATVKLSNMRRTIARRLTESKQTVPHFYLSIDVRLDALLNLRTELNKSLESKGVKISVNDFLVKALGVALGEVPDANVSFAGDHLKRFARADISVAVAIPGGLITPVIRDAANKRLSEIAGEMKSLAERARAGKLQPDEYTGGTASLSNLGMYGIRQFDAVINPPEGLILAAGAGEKRPHVVNDSITVATVMTLTGSFDHRAIDGAVGAELMGAIRSLIENPLSMLA